MVDPLLTSDGTKITQVAAPDAPALDEDAQLVRLAQAGDQRAFEMLVIKYRRRIERLVARMVRDANSVEDIAQDTFIKAYRALPGFRGESAFYTWLYRIAVNTAKKSIGKAIRHPLASDAAFTREGDDDEQASTVVDGRYADGADPEALMASRQIADTVNRAVEALSEDLRQAITLREMEGMSYESIAELMHCPIGTVRSRISRARDAIAKQLKPLLDPPREGRRW